MHCRIVLALMLAAVFFAAGPALSQRVPLILDQTIPLPASSDVWDVMPHPDGYYVWGQLDHFYSDSIAVIWGQTNASSVDSFRLRAGAPLSISCFFENEDNSLVPHALVAVQRTNVNPYGILTLDNFRLTDHQMGCCSREYSGSPPYPGSPWFGDFQLAAVMPWPEPPSASGRLSVAIRYLRGGEDIEMAQEDLGMIIQNFLALGFPGSGIGTARYVDFVLSGTHVAAFASGGTCPYSWTCRWSSCLIAVRNEVVTVQCRLDLWGDCAHHRASPVAATASVSDSLVYGFTRIDTLYAGMSSADSLSISWVVAGPYDFWFAAECVPDNSAEEFLCYDRGRRVFDVLDAVDGHSYGVTDTIDIATSGARIIGRYDSTFRRLVIRDSTSLKLYRFGEYLAADEHPAPIPSDLNLAAYPNPFNPSARIRFTLPRRSEAELVVYDVTGRRVSVLVNGVLAAGEQRVSFDGSTLPSGIYFARLTTSGAQATQKLLLLK